MGHTRLMEKNLSGNFGLLGCAWVACGVAFGNASRRKKKFDNFFFTFLLLHGKQCLLLNN
jgi:hypothetical protein